MKISILYWEGIGSLPKNGITENPNIDVTIFKDISDENNSLDLCIRNTSLVETIENSDLCDDVMMGFDREKGYEFYTECHLGQIKKIFENEFEVNYIESEMTPKFISGGRLTTHNKVNILN